MIRIQQLLTGLLFVAGTSFGQVNFPVYSDSMMHQSSVEFDGMYAYQSTSIQRNFEKRLLYGGFIDESMKDKAYEKHRAINRLGILINSEFRYIHGAGKIFKKDSLTWLVKAGYYAVGGMTYGQDVFGLLFYGNSSYLANTAVLTGTQLSFMQFQKIGFGLISKKDHSSVTLNLINVSSYMKGYIRKGEFRQNEDGSQMNLNLAGDFEQSAGSGFSKGVGMAIDVDYRIRVPWGEGKPATIQISGQNLGFAYLNNGLTTYEADSTYAYSGFKFAQLKGNSNAFNGDFSLLDSLGISKTTGHKLVALPGFIQVMKLVDLESAKKVQSFFGVRLYPTVNSIPSIFAGAYWKVDPRLHLSASGSYGGFGRFRAGCYATLNLKYVNWMVGTDDAVGLVSRSGFGSSLVTKLIWKLQ